jgi:4a-hydroxytetrahydrobiopterin dehydratase
MSGNWTRRERPERLEARAEFPDYEATRAFLEGAAEISSQEHVYPDISFGRTYVNLTLQTPEGTGIGPAEERFARHIDELLARTA